MSGDYTKNTQGLRCYAATNRSMIAPNSTYIVRNTYFSLPEYPCYTI